MHQSDVNSKVSLVPVGNQGHFVAGEWLWDWWQQGRSQAVAYEVPLVELEWLLHQVAGVERLELRLGTLRSRPQIALTLPPAQLEALWQQRLHDRTPVQYLVGRVAWRNLELQVSPAVLIPRPETELMIDLAIAATADPLTQPLRQGHWADLGTGSGAIALGLAQAFPAATVHAVDSSQAALAIAQMNAMTYDLLPQIQFVHGNWLDPLGHRRGQLSGLLSNPPYIPRAIVPTLQPEVAHHEPHLALDGGPDGLDCLRQLVAIAPAYLRSGGFWLVELMAGQAETVADLLAAQGAYQHIQIHADLAGVQRFVSAYRV